MQRKRVAQLCTTGIALFIGIYVVASLYYPGGSSFSRQTEGFSWFHNFWCNLMSEPALNGAHNPARPIAIAGMFVLCVSLSLFWWLVPIPLLIPPFWKRFIQGFGLLSMLSAGLLLSSTDHDTATNIASGLGMIALLALLAALYRSRWYGLFYFGLFNLILVALNNYLYYTPSLFYYLPLVQKISFASFLCWVVLLVNSKQILEP